METGALTRAFVLHTRRYGDTSLLAELFSETLGRVVCVAKGALSAKRTATRLQPFQPLLVGLRGRGEVRTLTRLEPDGPGLRLAGRMLYCGLYLNELMLKMTAREDPLPGLFARYEEVLGLLRQDGTVEPVLRRFEVGLLKELGHGLVLDVDAEGEPIDGQTRYTYRVDSGPAATVSETSPSYAGETFHALLHGRFNTPEIQREARVFMREVLDHYLNGQPIRSRDLFR
ncbi:MAG: DNA repair protein RecO [Chromatiaceae bacterium]|jgi:DNA repair protein RecO (recombination protein O)